MSRPPPSSTLFPYTTLFRSLVCIARLCCTGCMFVMTIDQQGSRTSADAVPGVLAALEPVAAVVGFARTIGDEVQGVLADPVAVAEAVRRVAVDSDWHIGIGIGEVDRPLPETTVEARGEAFYAARQAVEAAKSAPAHLVGLPGGVEEIGRAHV